MRRGNEALLRQVANIRSLQCLAAEARASRAAAELRKSNEIQSENEFRRLEVEERWAALLTANVIQAEMLPFLSAAFLAEEEAVRAAMKDVESAQAELEDRSIAFRTASTHRDNAQRMVRDARKARMRRREEITVQDASDRHAQRWSGR